MYIVGMWSLRRLRPSIREAIEIGATDLTSPRFIPIAEVARSLVVALATAIEHERHQAAADQKSEYDAEDHCEPAMGAHRCPSRLFPSPDRPANRSAEQCQQDDDDQGCLHDKRTRRAGFRFNHASNWRS